MQKIILLIICIALALPTISMAQDDGYTTYDYEDVARFEYPATWNTENTKEYVQIFNNPSFIETYTGNLLVYDYQSGDIAIEVSISDTSDDRNAFVRSYLEGSDAETLTPEWVSGSITGSMFFLYSIQTARQTGRRLALDSLEILEDVRYPNHLTVLTDGNIDIFILGMVFFNEEDISRTEIGHIMWIVPSGEYELHEETVTHFLESFEVFDAVTTDENQE